MVMNTTSKYIVNPLGLLYDNLLHAAIVATKKENSGSVVIDQDAGASISHDVLVQLVNASKVKRKAPAKLNNLSFTFESADNFPLFKKLI